MNSYVIFLSTESISYQSNDYGYWTGKTYTVQREKFPICEKSITINTKRFTNRKRTESAAQKLFDSCPKVGSWKVEEEEEAHEEQL
ncbi:hypothetical protein ACFVS2_20550 [Brevibacillus sp. NPDC058079]|uniref:hypothetical protein n=1 Tax=Brevibacillus sp. NPDC058079 TaxID=3346330 RepID=UPI0036F187F2